MNYYKKLFIIKNTRFSVELKPYILKIESPIGLTLLHTYKFLFLYKKFLCVFIPKGKDLIKTIFNIVSFKLKGLQKLYTVRLILKGLGFKASILKNFIIFKLGFSHLLAYSIPNYLKLAIYNRLTFIRIYSNNIQKLKESCNSLRNLKLPEPYKGKGIKYINEITTLKVTKKL